MGQLWGRVLSTRHAIAFSTSTSQGCTLSARHAAAFTRELGGGFARLCHQFHQQQPFLPTVSPTTTIPSDCQPPRNQINLPPFSCALDMMATTGHNQHTTSTALWGADFSLCTLGRELLLSCEIPLACSTAPLCSFCRL